MTTTRFETATRTIAICVCALLLVQAACNAQPSAPGPKDNVSKVGGFKKTTVVKDLEHPWGMVFLPDGAILVTERPGRMRIVRDGKLVEKPVEGVPNVLSLNQGGLMDVTIHPDFDQNKLVYFTYATGTEDKNHTVLARGRLDGARLTDVKTLFEAQPDKTGGEHFGSNLEWLPDGTLLVSIGDGGNPPRQIDGQLSREQAQRLDSHLGKILRLDADGKAPKDNPFVNKEGAKPEIYTYGNRNIQGLARDPQSGRVWANEHGPFGGDELNLVQPGGNYGWPRATTGLDYKTKEPVSENRSMPGMIDPKVTWSPSKAPSGLAVYTGDKFSEWRGSVLSGGLVTQDIRRIKLDGEMVTGQESIPIGRRVRDVVQGPDGFVYVLTDHKDGELLRLEPEK
jgi:glucose/arabinose dehydrogenase